MSEIEKGARELLDALMQNDPNEDESWESMAMRELIAALTPPEGFVLVPVELLRMVVGCAYPVSTEIDQRGYRWSEAYLDEVLPQIKAAMLAARPEAK
jgi:hypothetical protein